MPLDDVNEATFKREAEKTLPPDAQAKAIAEFAKLPTADDRMKAFRRLRGGSLTAVPSTKLGSVNHTA